MKKFLEKYLSEIVYGGIDGSVTTFAIVAGAVGAGLSSGFILVFGFANLLADGLSMSIGAYLASKAQKDNFHKHKKHEYWSIDNIPESERKEIEEIFIKKGFEGEVLDKIVHTICSDKDRWVDIMMKEELEMIEEPRSPFKIGLSTYISFLLSGFLPLSLYFFSYIFDFGQNLFLETCVLTGIAFAVIGAIKSHINKINLFRSIFETLLLGTLAALCAYYVGDFLEYLIEK